jgi:hypothetical protein
LLFGEKNTDKKIERGKCDKKRKKRKENMEMESVRVKDSIS